MVSTLSKKTITKQAKIIQETNNLTYMHALDIIAKNINFRTISILKKRRNSRLLFLVVKAVLEKQQYH